MQIHSPDLASQLTLGALPWPLPAPPTTSPTAASTPPPPPPAALLPATLPQVRFVLAETTC
jgi:hypothetical protein